MKPKEAVGGDVEIPAKKMSIKQITDELAAKQIEWDAFHRDLDGMSGSPGEGIMERIDELETELRRRVKAASST